MTVTQRSAVLVAVASIVSLSVLGCGDDSGDNPGGDSSTPSVTASQGADGSSSTASPGGSGETTIDLAATDTLYSVTLSDYGDIQQGISALAVGDFDGDSIDDMLIGAPFAERPGAGGEDAGAAYVVFGSTDLEGSLDLASDAPGLIVWGAIAGDSLGFSVAAGDLNGDDIDDVIIAAPASHTLKNIRTDEGEVYVIFGQEGLSGVIDTLGAEQDFTLIPAEGFSRLGTSLAVADVNGDGMDDLVAGAPFSGREPGAPVGGQRTTVGEVFVVFGASDLSGQRTVALNEEDVLIAGTRELDQFGQSLSAADVDGDGMADIIVGSPGFEGTGRPADSGAMFVFRGASQWPERLAADDAVLTVLGTDQEQHLGEIVRSADLDGDGAAEVMVSAAGTAGNAGAGRVYVVPGGSSGEAEVSDSGVISGPGDSLRFPLSVLIQDLNGDGSLELAAGASLISFNDRALVGVVYVLNGPWASPKDLGTDLSGTTVIEGAIELDGTGTGLAAGDLNGDGTLELLVAVAGNQETGGAQTTRPVVHVLSLP